MGRLALSYGSLFWYVKLMTDAISGTRKRGRPATGAISVHLRIEPAQLELIDAWIAKQPDPKPSRPEALRRLAALGAMADEQLRR